MYLHTRLSHLLRPSGTAPLPQISSGSVEVSRLAQVPKQIVR